MKQTKMNKIGILFFLICLIACKEKEKDTLPEIDFTQICQAKLKVYETDMAFYKEWGNIYLDEDSSFVADDIKDIKVYKDTIYILTHSNTLRLYSHSGTLSRKYENMGNISCFDLDTLHKNIIVLNDEGISFINQSGICTKKVNIPDAKKYTKCFIHKNKVVSVANSLYKCQYLLLDTLSMHLESIVDDTKKSKIKIENTPLFCIGKDGKYHLYKNILNDTVYKWNNNQFEPFFKIEMGKYGLKERGSKLKNNEQLKVLNIFHINNYWFLQYHYRLKYKGEFIDWNGLSIWDNTFQLINADFDSYIPEESIYLNGELDLYLSKDNTTLYQVYKKSKRQMFFNTEDKKLRKQICINYFKIK